MRFGDQIVPDAGIYVQLGITALAVGLLFFLPANGRIMALETSHRRFHMNMKDVARAYAASHRADREGVFKLPSEFDSVRERIAFLRDHPDLADLEPSVLEVAAQMSHISRELAQTYSDGNVQRARDFLTARQQEIEDFNIRIEEAKAVVNDMRTWHTRVELEESVAEAQLARLLEELDEILPEILSEAPAQEDETADAPVAEPLPEHDAPAERPAAPAIAAARQAPDPRVVTLTAAQRAAE
ncbi:hypothetical protein [Salipiger mucosus]|nr:hypothetical protein [Salipiger mucosus]